MLHIRGDGRVESDAQVASDSRKPLVDAQTELFAEIEEDKWRSTASVSPKRALVNSLER
jgi:hypothetical protein